MKKNSLIIAPAMAAQSEIELFAETLAFMTPYYAMDFVDPLSIVDKNLSNDDYYRAWQHHLAEKLHEYDAFIGFSFGGVILQQCFSVFERQHHPIVLFSTPTFIDESLKQRLGRVVELCEDKQVDLALDTLYKDVYYPNQQPTYNWDNLNHSEAAERLITGLSRVLTTNSSSIVNEAGVNHLHLIGEHSRLVNKHNVIAPQTGRLLTVPGAGMRVLQDNLAFCEQNILTWLNHE